MENLKIQNNIIEIAWKEGVKKLLFLGSSCIYQEFAKRPISEEELLTSHLENYQISGMPLQKLQELNAKL